MGGCIHPAAVVFHIQPLFVRPTLFTLVLFFDNIAKEALRALTGKILDGGWP